VIQKVYKGYHARKHVLPGLRLERENKRLEGDAREKEKEEAAVIIQRVHSGHRMRATALPELHVDKQGEEAKQAEAETEEAGEISPPVDDPEGRVFYTCPSCTKRLRLKNKHRGKRLRCPACQDVVSIPADLATTDEAKAEPDGRSSDAASQVRAQPPLTLDNAEAYLDEVACLVSVCAECGAGHTPKGKPLKVCKRCFSAGYCRSSCYKTHSAAVHKFVCMPLRERREEALRLVAEVRSSREAEQ
jgi:hypothetical protein